jgi:hypothetical protein
MTQNDVMQLIIGKATPATAVPTSAVNTVITDYSKLADGEIAVVNDHNMVLSATSVLTDDIVAESGIKLIKRNGTDIITSDLIKQGNILAVKPTAYAAGAEQVSYIGYNGTSGAIEVASSKLYVIRTSLQEQDVTGQGQQMILNAPYKSDASATQLEIALGLVQQLSRLFRRQAVPPIWPALICDVAYAATAKFAHDVTIVNGEYYITVGTNSQYNTSVELAVGDYVRINSTSTTTGCAVTNQIYKVTELTSGTVFKVDRPVEAPSGTYPTLISGANKGGRVTVLTAAKVAASTQLGIKLTGIARTFTLGKTPYSKVSFKIGLDSASSFGNTPVTYTTAMSLGQGTYEQVANLEWNLLGNDGNPYPGDFMWSAARALAVSGGTYHMVGINYFSAHSTGGIGAQPRRLKQLLIALPSSFDNNDSADILLDILAAYTTQAMTGITA